MICINRFQKFQGFQKYQRHCSAAVPKVRSLLVKRTLEPRQNDAFGTVGTSGTSGTLPLTNLTNCDDDGSVVVMTLNLYEAKTQLSALVDQAAAGAEIIIAKNGKPLAKLVAFRKPAGRKPGSAKGKIHLTADFDAPLPEAILAAFAGHDTARD